MESIGFNLVHRLQILKDNLAILKSKSNRVLAEIYKKPPDPDPTVSITSRNAIVKRNHEEQVEIPATMLHEKMELQVFTYSNLENEEASYRIQERSLKGAECGEHPHPIVAQQTNHLHTLHSRCSTFGPMTTNGNQGSVALAAVKKTSILGDVQGSHADGYQRRAGKEVAESSKHEENNAMVIDMTRAHEALRPRFLAVGLFLSVLLVNSRQLIDHMKRVWKIKGDMEASLIESEAGKKFILDFTEEGDWRHALLGGPRQYKGDALLVEGIAAGADPSSALMWVEFRKIPFYLLTKKLAAQPPVQSVLHKAVAEETLGVAREWDERFADSTSSRTKRKFKSKHCRPSDNVHVPVGVANMQAGVLGSVSEEVRKVRAEFPAMSEGETARFVAVCPGNNLEPELRDIVQQNAAILKTNLGILGKRRDVEINVLNQDLSANSFVDEGVSKRSKKDDGDQLSINLMGPHGEARQEQ